MGVSVQVQLKNTLAIGEVTATDPASVFLVKSLLYPLTAVLTLTGCLVSAHQRLRPHFMLWLAQLTTHHFLLGRQKQPAGDAVIVGMTGAGVGNELTQLLHKAPLTAMLP